MLRTIAIDDEPKALEIIKNHISSVPFLTLEGTFTDPVQAVNYLNENPVDLVFLDINMPHINGLQLLKNFIRRPLIIFTTAHSEYALAGYEVEAVDYLLKPFDFPRFLLAATRAKERLAKAPPPANDFFFVQTGNQRRRIDYSDILYVEGEGNYVSYFTGAGRILVRSSIRESLEGLPAGRFVQVHRSFIVALQWIDKIEDNHVFTAQRKISIGAKYREDFFRMLESLKR